MYAIVANVVNPARISLKKLVPSIASGYQQSQFPHTTLIAPQVSIFSSVSKIETLDQTYMSRTSKMKQPSEETGA